MLVESPHFLNGAAVGKRVEQPLLGGRIYNAAQGNAVFHIGNVHGEIATALHEFLGAIQRIDNQEAACRLAVACRLLFVTMATAGNASARPS